MRHSKPTEGLHHKGRLVVHVEEHSLVHSKLHSEELVVEDAVLGQVAWTSATANVSKITQVIAFWRLWFFIAVVLYLFV